jgi:outer membrane protein assembly factor BamB
VRHGLALVALLVALTGCAGSRKAAIEPPAELQPIDATLHIRKVWSASVGRGSDRLRLALSPATDGARIYAAAHDGRVAAFDAADGRRVWSSDVRVPLSAGPGYGGGVLALGSSDGELIAIDAESGEERWRQPLGSEILASPAIGSGVVVALTVDGRLRGFSLTDGRTLWTVEQSVPNLVLRGSSAPRIAGTAVVCGFDNGRIGAYELSSGDIRWELVAAVPTGRNELDRLVDLGASLQVVGRDVYAAGYHGRALAIDLDSGLVLWQQDLSTYAGIGVDVNNVYVSGDMGSVIALDRRRGAIVWRQDALRLRDLSAPTRYASAVVVGDLEGYLHWLDPGDGHFVARERVSSQRIAGAPLVVGQMVYAQAEDSTLAAFAEVDSTESE